MLESSRRAAARPGRNNLNRLLFSVVNAPELARHQIKRFQKRQADAAEIFHTVINRRNSLNCGDRSNSVFKCDDICNGFSAGFAGPDQPPVIHFVLFRLSANHCAPIILIANTVLPKCPKRHTSAKRAVFFSTDRSRQQCAPQPPAMQCASGSWLHLEQIGMPPTWIIVTRRLRRGNNYDYTSRN